MRSIKTFAAFALALSLWACDEPGPVERAGEEIDEAVEDARAGGETIGNRIDDTADDVRDGVNDAREELER